MYIVPPLRRLTGGQTVAFNSTDRIEVTRAECKRLLESFGVRVVLENADGSATLRCKVDEQQGDFSAFVTR